MLKKFFALSLGMGLFAMSLLLTACPVAPKTIPATSVKVGDVIPGLLGVNYTALAVPNGDQLQVFGATEDAGFLYLYFKIKGYKAGVLLCTIGNADNSGGGKVTGNFDWGWTDSQRLYGAATNMVEFKIQFNGAYAAGTKITNKCADGNLQIMTNTLVEQKLIASGVVDTSIGNVDCSDEVLELKVNKTNMGLAGKSLSGMAFFVGKYAVWGNDSPYDGLVPGNYAPAQNVEDNRFITYYIKGSDYTSVYRAGAVTGALSTSAFSGWVLADNVVGATLDVSLIDLDNASASAIVEVREVITNVTNAAHNATLTGTGGIYAGVLTLVDATPAGNQIQCYADPTKEGTTLVMLKYVDTTTDATNDASVTFGYTTIVTFKLTNFTIVDSSVYFRGNINGWAGDGYVTVALVGGLGETTVAAKAFDSSVAGWGGAPVGANSGGRFVTAADGWTTKINMVETAGNDNNFAFKIVLGATNVILIDGNAIAGDPWSVPLAQVTVTQP